MKFDKLTYPIAWLIIVISHAFLWIIGIKPVDVSFYMQLTGKAAFDENWFFTLLYYHGNPPLFSLFYRGYEFLFKTYTQEAIAFTLTVLHLSAFSFFYRAILKLPLGNWRKIYAATVMVLPIVFVYYNYPFYASFLFTSSCFILFALLVPERNNARLVLVAMALAFNCLFRSSWHLGICCLVLLPLLPKTHSRAQILALLMLFLPFVWFSKNAALFGTFNSSSWLGMNLAHGGHLQHLNNDSTFNNSLATLPAFDSLATYKEKYDENDVRIIQYQNIKPLTEDNLNNIRYLIISRTYLKLFKENFNWRHSAKLFLADGLPTYFESAANYKFLYKGGLKGNVKEGFPINTPLWLLDPLDLPNLPLKSTSGKYELKLSWYSFLYPLSFLLLLFHIKRWNKADGVVLLIISIFSFLYAFIDSSEANRMRMEIEPFFYYIVLRAITIIGSYFQKKKIST